jgi:Flp pilus assembly protein TadB
MRGIRLGFINLTLVSHLSHEPLAAVGVASTGVFTLAAWLADIEVYLRIGAALVALLAGIASGLYYYESWRQKRRERKGA